jgi:hypothetical protein
VQTLCETWFLLWSEDDVKPWLAMYAQNATFLDHALQINRQGLVNIEDHFKIWRNALPDAKAVFEGSWPGERLMRLRWTGTFLHDLPTIKAPGTMVNYPVRAEIIVRDDGLIEEAAEWYCANFWEVKPVSEYHRQEDFA